MLSWHYTDYIFCTVYCVILKQYVYQSVSSSFVLHGGPSPNRGLMESLFRPFYSSSIIFRSPLLLRILNSLIYIVSQEILYSNHLLFTLKIKIIQRIHRRMWLTLTNEGFGRHNGKTTFMRQEWRQETILVTKDMRWYKKKELNRGSRPPYIRILRRILYHLSVMC